MSNLSLDMFLGKKVVLLSVKVVISDGLIDCDSSGKDVAVFNIDRIVDRKNLLSVVSDIKNCIVYDARLDRSDNEKVVYYCTGIDRDTKELEGDTLIISNYVLSEDSEFLMYLNNVKENEVARVTSIRDYMDMVENGFDLQRGLPKEETNRQHYSVEEYKKITNFKQTKEILKSMKLELPDVPDINDININRLSKKRDEKILEEIIKPKDNVIQNLYQDNMNLHRQLTKQAQIIEEAEKYQKEREKILADNKNLHNEVEQIKVEYKKKESDIKWKYESKIKSLEKKNNYLKKVVDRFKESIDKFIKWICKKFDMGAENNLIRDFERENNILLDAEKQVKREEREKDLEMEM